MFGHRWLKTSRPWGRDWLYRTITSPDNTAVSPIWWVCISNRLYWYHRIRENKMDVKSVKSIFSHKVMTSGTIGSLRTTPDSFPQTKLLLLINCLIPWTRYWVNCVATYLHVTQKPNVWPFRRRRLLAGDFINTFRNARSDHSNEGHWVVCTRLFLFLSELKIGIFLWVMDLGMDHS